MNIKQLLIRICRKFLKTIPEKFKDEFIYLTINTLKNTDVLTYAYNNIGILKWENQEISGEKFVIEEILKPIVSKQSKMIFFDVGANVGSYSLMLSEIISKSEIYAFEPNPLTYRILKNNLVHINNKNIKILNFGFGRYNSTEYLYTYKNEPQSGHASLFKEYKDVIDSEQSKKEIIPLEVTLKRMDTFCLENGIDYIDFIKIDTEGYEYNIISGAKELLQENRIGIIQFEFNVTNIISKTFLKDFYDILYPRYKFYRVDTKRIIPLGEYKSINEIFSFQNILAINETILNKWKRFF